ncbi:23S rRNA (cytidine(2498)-2'-O)-methyltransferase RlmM [Shewanella dokdonensis]|uniref:Ribosomal RNA large subunit methyltransferase M n=1 Tax=Shewanella dokdonensis TaxID=712036 RepID=A0ABX8DDF5_9GAMM|nr:23S rRNA (cytidine(2498)-2'-O)-methyltransferase RlmM [Shewanella dokdonensis]MCL1073549.1 23S rRNA (cytidine(2498)-2'-O)-methyltransferase RlmM [Shewanella dokdonensis]QVK22681.1 23S rRNA (cytidine(2498)-2'-O)-methyltransferase RlmM [Shewanella dokdonensis]
MNNLFLFCRAGYEKECAAEIQDRAAEIGVAGFVKAAANNAYVVFQCFAEGDADKLARELPLDTLIFARQMFVCGELLGALPVDDRVTPVVDALSSLENGGELRVETPDTNEAKELLTFCRKFTVPLRAALKQQGVLLANENARRPIVHVCFLGSTQAYAGYSYSNNSSPFFMGIPRLKFPSVAPSRSTLKLDEAFNHFIAPHEQESRLHSGMNAVDLGACPGGWTYQLVRRGMFVAAVDNGPMADSLMQTGQVTHYREDGFRFEPKRKNIYWLVCDMVEKPSRVAELMEQWAVNGWFEEAIFNLKLPMKSRYKEVTTILSRMADVLQQHGFHQFQLRCKHLYHDRDEVTVHLCLRPPRHS